jgi:hypothetical protein
MTQATRSALMSVATTLAANIDATQDYIPVASTANFSTSVVAEVESTNEVVSFSDISSNRITYSQDFGNAAWAKWNSSISTNAAVAPDETTTADNVVPDTSTAYFHGVYKNISSTSDTASVYAKSNGYDYLNFLFRVGASDSQGVQFKLSDGTITASQNATGTITDAGDGWYRCSVTPSNSSTSSQIWFNVNDGGTPNTGNFFSPSNWTPDGSSAVLLWGAQGEEASAATTYLPTTSAALVGLTNVTRGANGTTAASATSGDDIQQLPFAAQGLLSPVSTTLSANITAAQDYVPLASTNGFTDYLNATIDSSEVVSFSDISSNLITYSEQFDNAAWSKTNITIAANSTTAPDGTTTADSWLSTNTASGYVNVAPTVITGQPYTFSIFAKAGDMNWFRITNQSSGTSGGWFNLTDGTLGTSNGAGNVSTITSVGDGWYRCERKFISVVAGANTVLYGLSDGDNSNSTPGSNKFIYFWGAQIEKASVATTYLPTTSAALVGLTNVTRGVNGTTAASATSGDTVTQTPLSTGALNMPLRLKGLSVSSDGTGAGRLTLCDKIGTHLCDVDIPDTKIFDLDFGGGILFPNGIYIANSDNITAYTLYTSSYNSPNLTAGG